MAVAYMLFGMAIGVVIGKHYYKHQIVDKKNQKIIEQVKEWMAKAEQTEVY